jgi:hypothetical protein
VIRTLLGINPNSEAGGGRICFAHDPDARRGARLDEVPLDLFALNRVRDPAEREAALESLAADAVRGVAQRLLSAGRRWPRPAA